MNEFERLRMQAKRYKAAYPPGTRIELNQMNDPLAPVPAGTRGTVAAVNDIGQLLMSWDNGRTLAVVPGVDSFRQLTLQELAEEQGINYDKLKAYLDDEMILEFNTPEECRNFFNTYDGQQLNSVSEMKEFQGEYGFGLGGKWYHISFDEALDIRDTQGIANQIKSAQSRAANAHTQPKTNTKDPEPDR